MVLLVERELTLSTLYTVGLLIVYHILLSDYTFCMKNCSSQINVMKKIV